MVSEKKKQMVKQTASLVTDYTVVGILDMHKLPARQLHEIRNKLRGQVVIRMVKKRLMSMALKERGLESLAEKIQGEPALFLTKENPFRIARVLQKSKSPAAAKAGDAAPRDIVVPAGPTKLPPGPAIGDLQKCKIPAGVDGDKIVVKKDTVVAKAGDVISPELASLLSKLEITPMEIGLNLIAVVENGVLYGKDVLFLSEEHYLEQLKLAASHAFSLSIHIGYYTRENVPVLLGRASREADSLALKAGIPTAKTLGALLGKARAEAEAVGKKADV